MGLNNGDGRGWRHCGLMVPAGLVLMLLALNGCTRTMAPAAPGATARASELAVPPTEARRIAAMPVGELLQRGNLALANSEYELATAYFGGALDKEPNSTPARLGLGEAAMATGDRPMARTLMEQVLAVEPDSVPALTAHGRILRESGDVAGAVRDLTRAHARAQNNLVVLTELAMSYERIPEQVAAAEPLYLKAVELSPTSATVRNNLGFYYMLQNRTDDAIRMFSAAAERDPKNERILNNLAAAWLIKGEESRALHIFKRTMGAAEAYNNIGYLYMTQKRWQEAETALNKALELSPTYYVRAADNLEQLRELRAAATQSPAQTKR